MQCSLTSMKIFVDQRTRPYAASSMGRLDHDQRIHSLQPERVERSCWKDLGIYDRYSAALAKTPSGNLFFSTSLMVMFRPFLLLDSREQGFVASTDHQQGQSSSDLRTRAAR